MSGVVETSADVYIEGRVEGSIRAGGTVTIAVSGVAMAEIHAGRADVRGVVVGNVVAAERIEVGHGARVVGDLRAPLVELDPGAVIEGRIDRRLPGAEEEPSSRTTARLKGVPLRRPSRPMTAVAPELPPVEGRPGAATPLPEAFRPAPHAPRAAERARMIPKTPRGPAKP